MKKILIVEDQKSIVELIKYNLELENYQVDYTYNGEEAYDMIRSNTYDLLLFDLMIPGIDGLSLTTMVRKLDQYKKTPIIMLTAKSTEIDKVLGLEIGADDYVTKPFSIRELLARIKVHFRRLEDDTKSNMEIIRIGDLSINITEHTVTCQGRPIELTLKEFLLLQELAQHRGKVLTRSYLLDKIWGYEYEGETRTVDVHIRHLRSKLSEEELIKTVRGMGYKIL